MLTLPTLTSVSAKAVIPEDTVASILRAIFPGGRLIPRNLNVDDCYIWAYVVSKIVPDSKLCEVYFKTGTHAFIQVGNLFYDVEDTLGVLDWKSLKYVKRSLKTTTLKIAVVKHPSVAAFIKAWMEKGERSHLDAMIQHHQGRVKTSNWDAYTWYTFTPANGKPVLLTDLKGLEFEIDEGTRYGALPVKAGIRIVDVDDPKVFFILKDASFAKLSTKSTRLKRCPIKLTVAAVPAVLGEQATHNRPVVVNEQEPLHQPTIIQPIGRHVEVDTDESDVDDTGNTTRIIDVGDVGDVDDSDTLQDYNDVDDLSYELYGHRLHEFEDDDYDDLDSISASKESHSSQDITQRTAPGIATLGKAYKAFFDQNPTADKARTDSAVAEESLVPIVRALFSYLSNLGFDVTAVKGLDFTKQLDDCSIVITQWRMLHKSTAISHLVVKINNLILDPCFKRLGSAVRVDNYALSDFQRLWRDTSVVASPSNAFQRKQSALFTSSVKSLQIPTPVFTEQLVAEASETRRVPVSKVTKIMLPGVKDETLTHR